MVPIAVDETSVDLSSNRSKAQASDHASAKGGRTSSQAKKEETALEREIRKKMNLEVE